MARRQGPLFGHLLIANEEAAAAAGNVTVRKNTGADVGTRPRINLIEGAGVTLTVADDAVSNEVDVTITAPAAGGGTVTDVNEGTGILCVPNPIIGSGTVNLNFPALTDEPVTASGDYFAFRDISVPAHRRVTRGDLFGTNLEAVRGLVSAADKLPYFTGAGTAAVTGFTAFGRSLVDDADAAAAQTTLGLVPGTNVQAYDAELAAIAGLVSAADRLPYFTGLGTASLATFTAFGRSIIDDADAAAVQVTLGLVPGTNVQAYDAELAAIAGLVSAADRLPYFTGLGTASLATFTAFGRSIIDDADAAAVQVTLGLVPGTNVQAYDAELAALAGLVSAADRLPYFTGLGTASLATFTAFGRSIVDDADAAAVQVTLGLVPGTNVQAYDAELAAIAGLVSAADRLPYFTGLGTAALATFTAFGRSLVDDADAAAAQTTLGLVPGTNVQAYDAELAAIAGLVSAADRLPYFTGLGTAALATFTAFGRSLADDADAAAGRTTLGLGTMAVAAAADYLLLAGRAGAANNPVLSTDADGIITGSAAAGFDLYARSTSDAAKGALRWDDTQVWWESMPNFTAATTETRQLALFNNAVTMSPNAASHLLRGVEFSPAITSAVVGLFDSAQFTGVYLNPTADMGQNFQCYGVYSTATLTNTAAPIFGSFRLFQGSPTLTSATATVAPYGPYTFVAAPTINYNALGIATLAVAGVGFTDNPTIKNQAAGTFNATLYTGFNSAPLVRQTAGTMTVAEIRRFSASAVGFVGGAVTADTALYVADLGVAGVTTALSVRSLGATVQMRHAGPIAVAMDAAPATKLDVDGDLALRAANVVLANGANNDIAIGARSFVRITGPAAAFSTTGFANGFNGKILVVRNTVSQVWTITNEATSAAANQITTGTGGNIALNSGTGIATFIYDATTSKWILLAVRDDTGGIAGN